MKSVPHGNSHTVGMHLLVDKLHIFAQQFLFILQFFLSPARHMASFSQIYILSFIFPHSLVREKIPWQAICETENTNRQLRRKVQCNELGKIIILRLFQGNVTAFTRRDSGYEKIGFQNINPTPSVVFGNLILMTLGSIGNSYQNTYD